jgi:trk system potassium uptake protein TrkA
VDISIIDSIDESFKQLPPDMECNTIEGEALNQDVLIRAGIENADGLAAVTNCDPLNAVVAHIAREVYHVPRVVVRNYNPRWRDMHEAFDLQMVSSTSWGAQRIEELLYHDDIRAVFSAGNGEVEIYELTVPERWGDRTIRELLEDPDVVPVSISRAGEAILPKLDMKLKQYDIVNLSATLDGVRKIRSRLAG